MSNQIFNEDCLDTLTKRKIEYDYVCFSPPDYDELDYVPIQDDKKYYDWQEKVYSKLKPKNKVVTIVVSNRRFQRKTIPKHQHITDIMKNLGYDLLAEKVWKKSSLINLYRYNYAFVMSYGKKGYKSKNTRLFKYDTWCHSHRPYKGYTYNFPKEMIFRCLDNYTDEGETVYDPFMGIGTTAIACVENGRNYYGSEINEEVCKLGTKRLTNYKKISKFI
tara:strand:- start:114 stop:770 length:657 start_codon:yes stop_codon:yes gene_type:complete